MPFDSVVAIAAKYLFSSNRLPYQASPLYKRSVYLGPLRPDRIAYNAKTEVLADPDRTFGLSTAIRVYAEPDACICTYVHVRSDVHCRVTTHANGYLAPNAHAAAANTHANGYPSPNAHTAAANTHTYSHP